MRRELAKPPKAGIIRADLARIGRTKDFVTEYFGPDGNNMFTTKMEEESSDEDWVRSQIVK